MQRTNKMSRRLKNAIKSNNEERLKAALNQTPPEQLNATRTHNTPYGGKIEFPPLAYAARKRALTSIRILLEHPGIDPFAVTSENADFLDIFLNRCLGETNALETLQFILNSTRFKPDPKCITKHMARFEIIKIECPEIIKQFLEIGTLPDYQVNECALHKAIWNNCFENARALLASEQMTAFHLASGFLSAMNRDDIAIEISKHPNFNVTTKVPNSVLHSFYTNTAQNFRFKPAHLLALLSHPTLPAKWMQNCGSEPLAWLYRQQHIPAITRLTMIELASHNANFRLVKDTGEVTYNISDKTAKDLLKAQPEFDVNTILWNGHTLLTDAIANDKNAEAIKLIDNPNTDINAPNSKGNTPLMVATSKGNRKLIEKLLTLPNINLYAQNPDGQTALLLAYIKKPELGQYLLMHPNFDVQHLYHRQRNLLMLAAMHQVLPLLNELINLKALPIDAGDEKGRTALILAAEVHDHVMIVRSLLHAGANPHLIDQDGCTALINAKRKQHRGVGALIKEAKTTVPAPASFNAPAAFFQEVKPKKDMSDLLARLSQ